MDNVTHTLAGVVVAEVALHLRQRAAGRSASGPSRSLTHAAWLASAGANNAPDLDFVYADIIERPLGYLLHHRGHTHTFVLAPLVALLPFAAAVWLERVSARRNQEAAPGRESWGFLYLLSVLGAVTHVLMDLTNNYGVHPLWPFDGEWLYGDTIFIVEPLWWVVLAAPLVLTPKARWGRALMALPPLAAIVLSIATGFVLPPFVAVLGALAPLLAVGSAALARHQRALLALGLGAAVLAVFAWNSGAARARAEAVLVSAHPDASVHDVVLAPTPGNPFCWTTLAIETEGDALRYRRLSVSTWPSMLTAEGCRALPPFETSAPRVADREGSTVDVLLHDVLEVPLARMRALADDDCRVAAYAVFSRAPFVVDREGETLLGDARYDMSTDLSWSKMLIGDEPDSCPRFVPSWDPPRADILF